ncbi:MAG: hypothetical protein FWF08_05330 [Oscillospiraceae bacterium]|nr:hypothetical protein [Oscillospiraceae bacterium]
MAAFFSKLWSLALCFILVMQAGGYKPAVPNASDPSLEPPEWPVWTHSHWVWENDGNENSAWAHAMAYLDHDMPVGAVIIDRPWDTGPTTFVPDPNLYPNVGQMIENFHDKDIRVMFWATCVVNEDAPSFQEAYDKGYFLNNGRTMKWWAGTGAYIDYTNPEAVEWWHGQMDKILELGADGWKVDGADPYLLLMFPTFGRGGYVSWTDYKELFYGDFHYYTREKYGKDKISFARPVDDLPFGLAFWMPPFTQREYNFAGWTGDEYNDWGGMKWALNDIFAAAKYNFVNVGSDIGGFRIRAKTDKDVLLRWTQLGAFCSVMENGNDTDRLPWAYDDETLDIYRNFVYIHHELIPYIYSQTAYSYELVKPMIRPQPGEYMYLFGDNILVAPFTESGTKRDVTFPAGEWIYMFDETKVYSSGKKTLDIPLDEFPVFIRKGAIVPVDYVSGEYGTLANALFDGYTNILTYPAYGEEKFGLYEEDKTGVMLSYVKDSDSLTLKSGATDRPLLFKVCGEAAPQSAEFSNGAALPKSLSMTALKAAGTGYFADADGVIWVAVSNAAAGAEIVINY